MLSEEIGPGTLGNTSSMALTSPRQRLSDSLVHHPVIRISFSDGLPRPAETAADTTISMRDSGIASRDCSWASKADRNIVGLKP